MNNNKCLLLIFFVAFLVVGCGRTTDSTSQKEIVATDKKTEESETTETSNKSVKIQDLQSYSENLAWISYTNDGERNYNNLNYGCIDKKGKMLFHIDGLSRVETTVTPFENGYSYIENTSNNTLLVIHKSGKLTQKFPKDDDSKVKLYAGGYVWEEKHIADFEKNYYRYILYSGNGEKITEFKYNQPEPLENIYYYGKGVFGYDDNNAQKFYCTSIGKWVQSKAASGCHGGYFYDDKMLIGVSMTGYLEIIDAEGNITTMQLPEKLGNGWSNKGYISGDMCLLRLLDDFVLLDIKNGKCREMKNEKTKYMGELPNKPVCIDKRLFLPLKGEDELLYVAVFDINGNIIGTPIQGEHYDYSEGRLIVDSNTKLAVYNENGEPIFSLSDLGYTAVTPYKDGVARAMYEKESDEDERSAMSRILGSRIIDGSQVSLHGDDMIGQKGWYYIDLEGKRLFERVDISEAIELEK